MKKKQWKKRIIEACEGLGTYKECFIPVIDTLASTLEVRDTVEKEFIESGGKITIEHTNKYGATNIMKNPALSLYMDLNQQALTFSRELGLSPLGLRRISGTSIDIKSQPTGIELLINKICEEIEAVENDEEEEA